MEENSITVAILREIRDNTARTHERVDHLTEHVDHLTDRVDGLSSRVDAMAAVQIRQEQVLLRLADIAVRHEEALQNVGNQLERIHARIDNIFDGPVVGTLRDHETRLRRLEGRDQ